MISENDLMLGNEKASDDQEGMDLLIQSLYNEIAQKRTKAFRLIAQGKANDAIELQNTADDLSRELDKLIKSHMQYQKYLQSLDRATGKGKSGKADPVKISSDLKNQKSSNGDIVTSIPKS